MILHKSLLKIHPKPSNLLEKRKEGHPHPVLGVSLLLSPRCNSMDPAGNSTPPPEPLMDAIREPLTALSPYHHILPRQLCLLGLTLQPPRPQLLDHLLRRLPMLHGGTVRALLGVIHHPHFPTGGEGGLQLGGVVAAVVDVVPGVDDQETVHAAGRGEPPLPSGVHLLLRPPPKTESDTPQKKLDGHYGRAACAACPVWG